MEERQSEDFVEDLPDSFTRGFGILKDEIDPAAPHDMASI